jgi:hypothetical protein
MPNSGSDVPFELRTPTRQGALIILRKAHFSPKLWTPKCFPGEFCQCRQGPSVQGLKGGPPKFGGGRHSPPHHDRLALVRLYPDDDRLGGPSMPVPANRCEGDKNGECPE